MADQAARKSTASYHRGRAAEERAAARQSSCIVRDCHLELAELHDLQAEGATPPPQDASNPHG